MASVSVALLSFAHDKFGDRVDATPHQLRADHVVYACFYLSTLLSIMPGAFAWLTHGGMIQIISAMVERRTAHIPRRRTSSMMAQDHQKAIGEVTLYKDSLFWIMCFLCPAVISMSVGITVLVWSDHSAVVATVTTLGLFYCIFQVSRVIIGLSNAYDNVLAERLKSLQDQ